MVALSSETVSISCPSEPASWRVIPVESDSIDLLQAIQLPVNQTDSLTQNGRMLNVMRVNGSYEGIYRCREEDMPSYCLIVQGELLDWKLHKL